MGTGRNQGQGTGLYLHARADFHAFSCLRPEVNFGVIELPFPHSKLFPITSDNRQAQGRVQVHIRATPVQRATHCHQLLHIPPSQLPHHTKHSYPHSFVHFAEYPEQCRSPHFVINFLQHQGQPLCLAGLQGAQPSLNVGTGVGLGLGFVRDTCPDLL